LDQVEKIETASAVALGDGNDQPEVGPDKHHLGFVTFGDGAHQLGSI